MKIMNTSEIKHLCNANSEIKEGYEFIKSKKYLRNIIDMWSMAHACQPVVEMYILCYEEPRNIKYCYIHDELTGEKTVTSEYVSRY